MITYSNSKINTFNQCAKKYKFQYIDKVETDVENTIEAFMGDLVHRTLEKLYKDLKYTKLNSLEELETFYKNLWQAEYNEGILIVKEEYTAENYQNKGLEMIRDYYKSYHPFNDGKTIGLETTDYYELNEKYKIHVRIDRLVYKEGGIYEIHDYKTNNQLKTQQEADEDRQLAIYALGVKKLYPDAKKIVLVWHYLAFNKEIRSYRTDKQLLDLKTNILEDIKNIEQEKIFDTSPSALCDYCPFKKICPNFKHFYETKEISDELGKKLAEKYLILKEKEKILNEKLELIGDKLKQYARQKQIKSVFCDKGSITIWSKNAVKLPAKNDPRRTEFIKVMKSLNLYAIYSDIDTWALEKDYDKLTAIEKQVLDHFTEQKLIEKLYVR